MAELRRDPRTGVWTLVAPERRRRPQHVGGEPAAPCMLCPGAGPRQTLLRGAHGVQALAHGRPGLRVERTWTGVAGHRAPAVGAHEVLVEGSDHGWQGWRPRRALLAEHLRLLDARRADLRQDARIVSFVWVRDHGTGLAGPGVHPHGQLLGLPVAVPTLAAPSRSPGRFIGGAGAAWAAAAEAPAGDFEVLLVPSQDPFETAELLWCVLVSLAEVLSDPPLSVAWASGGVAEPGVLQVRPWLGSPGGLDLVGTGFVSWQPEDAADQLRRALP